MKEIDFLIKKAGYCRKAVFDQNTLLFSAIMKILYFKPD